MRRGFEGGNAEVMRITRPGLRLGGYEPLLVPGPGLQERKILQALIDVYPKALTADQLTVATGYQWSGFRNSLGALRMLACWLGGTRKRCARRRSCSGARRDARGAGPGSAAERRGAVRRCYHQIQWN